MAVRAMLILHTIPANFLQIPWRIASCKCGALLRLGWVLARNLLLSVLNRFDLPLLCLDGPIRANRFPDSREPPDSRDLFQGSRIELLFCESRFGGLKIVNRRFEAIRVNRSHVMKIGVLCESIRANRFT